MCNFKPNRRELRIDRRMPFRISCDEKCKIQKCLCRFADHAIAPNRRVARIARVGIGKKARASKASHLCDPCNHNRVGMIDMRRLDVTWQGDGMAGYETLLNTAKKDGDPPVWTCKENAGKHQFVRYTASRRDTGHISRICKIKSCRSIARYEGNSKRVRIPAAPAEPLITTF